MNITTKTSWNKKALFAKYTISLTIRMDVSLISAGDCSIDLVESRRCFMPHWFGISYHIEMFINHCNHDFGSTMPEALKGRPHKNRAVSLLIKNSILSTLNIIRACSPII